jgi:hypothetical protein
LTHFQRRDSILESAFTPLMMASAPVLQFMALVFVPVTAG